MASHGHNAITGGSPPAPILPGEVKTEIGPFYLFPVGPKKPAPTGALQLEKSWVQTVQLNLLPLSLQIGCMFMCCTDCHVYRPTVLHQWVTLGAKSRYSKCT